MAALATPVDGDKMSAQHTTSHRVHLVVTLLVLSCFAPQLHAKISSLKTQTIEISSRRSKIDFRYDVHPQRSRHLNDKSDGYRVELIHRDSLSLHNLTRIERIRRAVQQSKHRAQHISANIMKHRPNFTIASSNFTTPVDYNYGTYLMELRLGSNPIQAFLAIVDTGSDLTWVQCHPCHRCYEQSGTIFHPEESSSYKELSCSSPRCLNLEARECDGGNCKYFYAYDDNTYSKGDFSTETVTMTTTSGAYQGFKDFAFGCGHDNFNAMEHVGILDEGGIVGLGQSPVSLITQLGSVIEQKFAYCLLSFDESLDIKSELLIGSVATINAPGVQSTPMLKQAGSPHYYVGINAVSVGGKRLEVNLPGGTIVDSGTTLTLIEGSAYSIIRDAFKAAITLPLVQAPGGSNIDLCFNVEGRMASFTAPTLTFHFIDADFNPPPENYFIHEDNRLCLAMTSNEGVSIIGNYMHQGYHFEYDLGNSKLSFIRSPCGCTKPSC